MQLPAPQKHYDLTQFNTWKLQLEQADSFNYKRDKDNYVGKGRLILSAPNGTYYAITVSNTGTLSTTPVTP